MNKSIQYLLLLYLLFSFGIVSTVEQNNPKQPIENNAVTKENNAVKTKESNAAVKPGETSVTSDIKAKTATKTKSTNSSKTKIKEKSNTDEDEDPEDDENNEPIDPFKQEWTDIDSVNTDGFKADMYCLYEKDKQCKLFRKKLKKILKSIDKAIDIKERVNFSVYLTDLTAFGKGCLGIVLPPSFIYLKESGSNKIYSYPQALARQLNINGKEQIKFPEMDFTIVINIDQEDEDIEKFGEFALAREILHGMGIITTGDLVNSNGYKVFAEDFYAPQRASNIEIDDSDINGVYVKFEKFYPISIFEKYIVPKANPNDFIFDSLNDMHKVTFPIQYYNFMNVTEDIEMDSIKESYEPFLSTPYYEQAKKIAQLYNIKGSVGFKATDGSVVPLQTFDEQYIKSSSISHIDIPKINTYSYFEYDPFNKNEIKDYLNEDFILNYTYMFVYDVDTIASIVAQNNKYGVIGPGILKILTTLGWTEKGQDRSSNPSASMTYEVATEVKIEYTNYVDLMMKHAQYHNHFNYSSLADNNRVCDPKAYAITLLVLGLTFGF